ncbi:Glu/Leu/Phe/Val family dehydrogenase [Sphingomonas sp. TDK1]|uniref:Glu/Leu/Phe/Val family dehydrogenase n=1 Tax=Sphingomonas sp. TDK1 TaxID=453247 RepID=UPI0007D9B34C|nr:Glu/Leu/Phe/Val dehydrogenase dimerization domain-containing protein [Sphingomonas sp. TDK1]OAN67162.1 amino acid dehydrogenase [Sphingomonas sp. TDK1]
MVLQVQGDSLVDELVMLKDVDAGLDGVIAIHSTVLGPGAGGCRLWHYADGDAAFTDAARLAEGMSYKNAMAGLPLGGAKAVLRRPAGDFDRVALFRAFGRAVARLGGRYVTAEDVGTGVADMEVVARETQHVAGLPQRAGRPGGDPSPHTALGVFVSMAHAARRGLGRELAECTVAIQGVGHVGEALAHLLHGAGARLIVADVDSNRVARVAVATGAEVASTTQVLAAQADIFAPCALGAVINERSVEALRAQLVCGAANNQLATPGDGERLARRGILYAPDYVVNAGGIINVAGEYLGWTSEEVTARVEATGARLAAVLDHAEAQGLPPHVAADSLARAAIAAGRVRAPAMA